MNNDQMNNDQLQEDLTEVLLSLIHILKPKQ